LYKSHALSLNLDLEFQEVVQVRDSALDDERLLGAPLALS
jgi:hypothetical protein